MTNQERIQEYIKINCSNCKNKNKQDCEIRVFRNENVICTKCIAYEREY